MGHIIYQEQYIKFINGDEDNAISKIWSNLLNKLPAGLRKEAETKGFKLIPDKEFRQYSMDDYNIDIPNSSTELDKSLSLADKHITVMKD